ncbi:MAG: hypothetical protein K0A90_00225 [Methanosarcinaceae archaeon]|nr:hypothetical protein [Methanosarcinaceae archaeon]
MTSVTSITKKRLELGSEYAWVYRYTKAYAGDTLDATGEFNEIDMIISKTSAGINDPASQSAETITFSVGTGAGMAIVFGKW